MGGLTALVWLPDEVITREAFPTTMGFRRSQSANGTTEPPADEPGDRGAAARAVAAARIARFEPLPDADEAPTDPGGLGDGSQLAAAPTAELIAPEQVADTSQGYGFDGGYDTDGFAANGSMGTNGGPGTNGSLAANGSPGVNGSPGANGNLGVNGTVPAANGEGAVTPSGVIVPPPATVGEENRLPIFESVESDWFRRGRRGTDWTAPTVSGAMPGPAVAPVPASAGWSSPADAGWQAAEVAQAPVTSGTTRAGLPKRVPKANLVPGGVTMPSTPEPAPRSAAQTRDRLSSFQQGVKNARAATPSDDDHEQDEPGGEEMA
jgi:hypothetical protein